MRSQLPAALRSLRPSASPRLVASLKPITSPSQCRRRSTWLALATVPPSASLSWDLPQFESTLGTLTSVEVSTQAVGKFEYEIFDDYGDPGSGQVNFSSTAGTIGPGVNIESPLSTPLASISWGQDGHYYSPLYTLESDRNYAVPGQYFSQYIGSGSNVIELYAAPSFTGGEPGFNFIGNFVAPTGQLMVGEVDITATVTYTFTSSVPEPSSFVLTSLGAVGVAVLMRRIGPFLEKKADIVDCRR